MNLVKTRPNVYINMDYIDSIYKIGEKCYYTLSGDSCNADEMTEEAFNTVLMYGKIKIQ